MARTKKIKKTEVDKSILSSVPYQSVTESGLIEVGNASFSVSFAVSCAPMQGEITYDIIEKCKTLILSIGLNDFQLSVYHIKFGSAIVLTVNVDASSIEEAENKANTIVQNYNATAYNAGVNTQIGRLTLTNVLMLINSVYAAGNTDIFKRLGDHKEVTQKILKNNMTTKHLVAPQTLEYEKDYITTDKGFSRILFVNSFADHVSENFLDALSSNVAVTSVFFHPVDPNKALYSLRAELKDLSEKAVDEKSGIYPNREEVRVKEGYTALLQDAIDTNTPVYEVGILIAVCAETKEELDQKTEKFLYNFSGITCKILPMDYQQENALKSILPLAKSYVEVSRLFSASSASVLFPVISGMGAPSLRTLNEVNAQKDFFVIKSKLKKSSKKDKAVKKTVQDTIPYITAHWEDGIIEITPGVFSKAYVFSDINYHTSTEDDQISFLEKYAQLLNRIDSSMRCQIVLMNKNVDMNQFKVDNTLPMKGDSLDVYRTEYNRMIVSKMSEGRNNLKKERYFVISTEADSIEAAKTAFNRIDPEIVTAFKDIGGSTAVPLTTPERLETLYDIYNIGHEGSFMAEEKVGNQTIKAMDLETLCKLGITSKDLIAPSGFNFRRDWFRMGDKYCRILYLTELPNSLSDKFLSDLTSANCNMIVSMNLKCLRQDKAVSLTRRQLTNINTMVQKAQQTASKNGYSMELVPAEIRQAQTEAEELLSGLTGSNQKMFVMCFTILVYGDTMEELDTHTSTMITCGNKYLCNIKRLDYMQEDGLATTLPLCNNRLTIHRTLTTNSTVIFTPFDVQELSQPHGLYYGQNASSHNLIIYDRKQAQNGNGWILGTPGSGKSFAAKQEIATVLLNTDDDILIIDPEREYSPMVAAFGGSIVRIAPGSKWHINPLDLDPDYGDDDDPIVLKSDFMISICETAVGGKYGLEPIQNSIIDRCVNQVYRNFMEHNMDPAYTPTLLDFQNVLESQPEMAARELAIALELYTKGALNVFAQPSNVDINNRMVVYDIKDIGSSALRTLAYLVVLDNIWNRVIKNRRLGKRTWVYMDEIYVLFEKEQSTNFIRQIFSRGRKYGAIMTALTQNVTPILSNDVATTMLSNSAFIELLNQAPVDRDVLAALLNISPQQVSYINSASPGHGLLYVQNVGLIPFANDFPRQICPELYKIMTSKPDELMNEFR